MRNLIALLVLAWTVSPALAQSITDPGFETPPQGQGKFVYRPAGSSWTFTGGAGLAGNGSGFTASNYPAPQGGQVAFFQGGGQVSQTVTAWPAGTYQVAFQAAQRNYNASNQAVAVLVDGQTISTITPGGIDYQTYYTAPVKVTAGDHTLAFQTTAVPGKDWTAFLDSVSIVKAGSISPTVAASPFVATSGKMIGFTFTSLANGQPVTPSQVVAAPTMSVNGQVIGTLGVQWVTGYHPVALLATPNNYQIRPGDRVTLSAPVAWAFGRAGAVQSLDGVAVENRTGKPIVAREDLTRTLRIGINNNHAPTSYNLGYYFPFKNIKYRVGYGSANRGKFNVPGVTYPIASNGPGYPGIAGLWLVQWDASNLTTPVQFSITTATPTKCTVAERVDLRQTPANGIGYTRVFDVQPTAGSVDFDISFSYADQAWSGKPAYDNLWVVQPGDWDLVNGAVQLDRTDPLALSRIYVDRIGTGVGSIRWVDSTVCGGNPQSTPYPEFLPRATDENWGVLSAYKEVRGYTAAGPVDTKATPWVYSPHFRQPGEAYTATLGTAVTTAPATGTQEVWTFPDGATAPLMGGLEVTIDNETCRIISGSDTSWTVYRGSNGTTPATHDPGPVSVSGRRSWAGLLDPDGSRGNGRAVQLTLAQPHNRTTGDRFSCDFAGWPNMAMTDGSTWNLLGTGGFAFVNGPKTCVLVQAWGKRAVPVQTYPLNPVYGQANWLYESGGAIPIEAACIATGRFPNADMHVNVPVDAVDDMVWEMARRVRDNFPSGRRVYVEYSNEPWNWGFNGYYYHITMGSITVPGNPYLLCHYAYRAGQVHEIFRKVFDAAGRKAEIRGIINNQMGSGSSQTGPDLAAGLKYGTPFDAVGIAPYWSVEDTPLNRAVAAQLDDEQWIDVIMADQRANPRQLNAWVADTKKAIDLFNKANAATVKLYGYEGGIEFANPWDEARNHDLIYNPNWYACELDWLAWCQSQGFERLNIYSHAMWWNPHAWGGYHTSQQRHSRGDGLNGAALNQAWKRGVRPVGVNQDSRVDAVRPQAWLDWLGTLGP